MAKHDRWLEEDGHVAHRLVPSLYWSILHPPLQRRCHQSDWHWARCRRKDYFACFNYKRLVSNRHYVAITLRLCVIVLSLGIGHIYFVGPLVWSDRHWLSLSCPHLRSTSAEWIFTFIAHWCLLIIGLQLLLHLKIVMIYDRFHSLSPTADAVTVARKASSQWPKCAVGNEPLSCAVIPWLSFGRFYSLSIWYRI